MSDKRFPPGREPGPDAKGQPVSPSAVRRESVLQRRLGLGDLLDLPSFNELVKGFVELYRVGIKVFDERGSKLVDLKVGNGDFCGYVFSFPHGRQACTATVGRVKDGPLGGGGEAWAVPSAEGHLARGRVTVPCFTGLRYLLMPVQFEGDELGRVVFGPFTPDDLHDLPASLLEISETFDAEKARALLQKIRRAPEATVAKVMLHFALILDTLVAAGQKTFLTSQLHIEATLEANRELEQRNRKLEELNVKLKELDRLKSSFLATVSHELRTPLTSIIGYSEMLAEGLAGALNAEQSDYARTIMDKGETLLRLISSILDISQIEAGKVRLLFASVDVGALLEGALSSVRPQAQKKGVSLETRGQGFREPVLADEEKLRQVVVNLLANAVKFTPAGGKVSVFLSELEYQPDVHAPGYRIIVEDSGVGIPQDQFDRIFETFYQVDSSSTREYGGAGLGLAIVQSYVKGHGGVVRVSSELGHGSRFTVVLPCEPKTAIASHIPPPASEPVPDRF